MNVQALQAAAASPAGIRRLWRSGPDGAPPDWQLQLRPGPDGTAVLEEPFSPLAKAALEFGESFLSLDIAEAGLRKLEHHPEAANPAVHRVRSHLGHAKALAMLRTGSIGAAQDLLQRLWENDRGDLEISAALARTHKDLAFTTAAADERRSHLRRSHELYLATFRQTASVFPGVNAAATALWLSDRELAETLAADVAVRCRELLAVQPDDYWTLATLAECCLIRRDLAGALQRYARSRELIGRSQRWANLNSTRLQARRLCAHLVVDFAPFESGFNFPRLVVFSGHMFDRPDRPAPRFPEALEPVVRAAMRQRLEAINAGFGISAAACGRMPSSSRKCSSAVATPGWCCPGPMRTSSVRAWISNPAANGGSALTRCSAG